LIDGFGQQSKKPEKRRNREAGFIARIITLKAITRREHEA
jgi:ribosomal protein L34